MVNFNFGLGGLMGGDDKKDKDNSANSSDGSTGIQDDSSVTQNDNQVLSTVEEVSAPIPETTSPDVENTTEEIPTTASEPVFDEKVETTETDIEPELNNTTSFDETDTKKDSATENTIDETSNTVLTTQNNEEDWLNKKEDPTEPVSLETETPEIQTFGQPEQPEVTAKETLEPVTDNFAESTPEISEDISATTDSAENPFPEASTPVIETTPVENVAIAPLIPKVPKAQTAIPEIPTFDQPEQPEVKAEETPEPVTGNFAESSFEIPKKTPIVENIQLDNTTSIEPTLEVPRTEINETIPEEDKYNEDFLKTDNDSILEENPLAPAAMATIGGSLTRDDNDDDNEGVVKDLDNTDPVNTLQELKDGITQFVNNHNAKIKEYKDQISELNKKIREEKNILKNKQKKSAKILDDLNTLVANFSETNSIKKKVLKKTNHKKKV